MEDSPPGTPGNESNLKAVLDRLESLGHFGHYTTDLRTGIWTGSPGFIAMFGLEPKTEYSVEEFQALVHEDDIEETMRIFARCMEERRPFVHDYRCRNHRTRAVIYVSSVSDFLYDDSGEPAYLKGIKYDRTRERIAEAKLIESNENATRHANYLERLLDALGDAIFTVRLSERKITNVNRAATQIFGYPTDGLIGQPTSMFYADPEDFEQFGQRLRVAIESKAPLIRQETMLRRKNGDSFPALITTTFLHEDPDDLSVISIVRDISQSKEYERELEGARQRAESALKARSEFVARINHELRTPLHSAMLSLELLESDPGAISSLRNAVHMAQNIVEDVLDFSRLESGNEIGEHRRFALRAGIFKLIDVYRAQIRKDVNLTVHIADNVPEHFFGDPRLLFDVVRNLIANAARLTAQGGIHLELEWADLEQNLLKGSVTDTGPGIQADSVESLFEPFVQGPMETDRKTGTGLGLYIAAQSAKVLGGRLEARNRSEGGAEFFFHVELEPCRRWVAEGRLGPNCSECLLRATATGETTKESAWLQTIIRRSVLIVEDEDINRMLLARLLEKAGFERIYQAATGAAALEELRNHNPDFVLLDMNLPDMTGIDVVRTSGISDLPGRVVVITGDYTDEVFTSCRRARLRYVLSKPASMIQVLDAMASIVESQSVS